MPLTTAILLHPEQSTSRKPKTEDENWSSSPRNHGARARKKRRIQQQQRQKGKKETAGVERNDRTGTAGNGMRRNWYRWRGEHKEHRQAPWWRAHRWRSRSSAASNVWRRRACAGTNTPGVVVLLLFSTSPELSQH